MQHLVELHSGCLLVRLLRFKWQVRKMTLVLWSRDNQLRFNGVRQALMH